MEATTAGSESSELHYAPLLFGGFQKAAIQLSQDVSKSEGFVHFLFDLIEHRTSLAVGIFSIQELDIRQLLTWCTWLLCEGKDPSTHLAELKAQSTPRVCTKVWNDGYFFYRCRDCERSPSSSICAECFRQGDHKGHDFIFERSVYGGCCDCGNSFAWKPSGFCPSHSGTFSVDPSLQLSEKARKMAQIVIRTLLARLMPYFPREGQLEEQKQEIISAAVGWLRFIGSHSEAFLQIIREAFMELQPPPIEVCFRSCLLFQGSLLDELIFLYLDLLQDPSFKECFVRHYMKLYPELIKHMIATKGDTAVVYKISPQLFSIPELTLPLVKQQGGLLDIMIEHLTGFFRSLSKASQLTGYDVLDCENSTMAPNNYYAFTNDLNTLLGDAENAKYIVTERLDLFEQFVQMVSLLQSINPAIRKTDIHTEYESDAWQVSFSLEIELTRCITDLASALYEGATQFDQGIGFLKAVREPLSQRMQYLAKFSVVKEQSIVEYDILVQPISFHIPLHRTLAKFVHSGAKKFPTTSLWSYFKQKGENEDRKFVQLLLEQPLQLQVLLAQIRVDMWIRNGPSVINQAYIYRGSFFLESFHSDILLLQSALVLLGSNVFAITCLKRFGLLEWFDSHSIDSPPDLKGLGIFEDFLRFIITIASDRYQIGMTEAEIVRKELIHLLALGDFAHSKLISDSSVQVVEHPEFESILKSVATCTQSSVDSPGIYQLKRECWVNEFDPFFHRWDPQSQQIAVERYNQYKPKRQESLHLPKPFEAFSDVTSILHEESLYHPYYMILYFLNVHSFHEPLLRPVLHLLMLAVDNPNQNAAQSFAQHIRQPREYDESILGLLSRLYSSGRYEDTHDYLLPLLQKCFTQDKENAEIILHHIPEFERPDASPKESASEQRKKAAKARQAEIMAKFAKQQKEFLKSSQDKEKEVDRETSNDYEPVSSGTLCALCRSSLPEEESALGLIALVQPCNVLRIAKSQNMGVTQVKWSQRKEQFELPPPTFRLTGESTQEKEDIPPVPEETLVPEPGKSLESESILGVNVQYCGHCMHDDCFSSFFSSMVHSHFDGSIDPRVSATNVDNGEFLCPVCRRLSNSLIPIVPQDKGTALSATEVKEEEYSQQIEATISSLKQSFADPMPPLETESLLRVDSLMKSFSMQLYAVHEGKSFLEALTVPVEMRETVPCLLDGILCSVGTAECLLWNPDCQSDFEKHFYCLRYLLRATLLRLHFEGSKLDIFNNLLKRTFEDFQSFRDDIVSSMEGEQRPLLASSVFNQFARLVLVSGQASKAQVIHSVHLFFPALVIQSFLQIAKYARGYSQQGEESSFVLKYFDMICSRFYGFQPKITLETLLGLVQPLWLQFLRRAVILIEALDSTTIESPFLLPTEYRGLADLLQLPSLEHIFCSPPIVSLIETWCTQIQQSGTLSPDTNFALLSEPVPTSLIQLPATFQELILQFMGVKCTKCGLVPKHSAICLICGTLCCVASTCCFEGDRGECYRHSVSCGNIFLFLQSTFVLILRGDRRSAWGSLYLDDHGEEDPGLRRGKPLHLSESRYSELKRMWLSYSFDHESKVLATTVRDGYLV